MEAVGILDHGKNGDCTLHGRAKERIWARCQCFRNLTQEVTVTSTNIVETLILCLLN